jgi:hypothetical protein
LSASVRLAIGRPETVNSAGASKDVAIDRMFGLRTMDVRSSKTNAPRKLDA